MPGPWSNYQGPIGRPGAPSFWDLLFAQRQAALPPQIVMQQAFPPIPPTPVVQADPRVAALAQAQAMARQPSMLGRGAPSPRPQVTPRRGGALPKPPGVQTGDASGRSVWDIVKQTPAALEAFNSWLWAPQGGDESNLSSFMRNFGLSEHPAALPERLQGLPVRAAKGAINWATGTPNNPGGIFGAPAQAMAAQRQTGQVAPQAAAAAGPAMFSAAAVASMADWARNRGAQVTSVERTQGRNAAVGGVGNSYHLTGQAFDSTPPKGMSMSEWHGELKQRFGAQGWDVINEGDHVHVEPPQGATHSAEGMLGNLAALAGNFGAPAPAFNPAPFQNAMAASNQAAALQAAPFEATFTETPIPERPVPTPFVSPDYAAGDAAFAATQPINPFDDPKEEVRLERQQYWKGIGQAMASLSGEEGIGTMLMRMGSGALAGRARGQEMVDEKLAEFNQQMVEYNRLLANREDQKAAQVANTINSNLQQMNTHADQVWADNAKKIADKNPQVVNGRLVVFSQSKDDPNTYTMKSTQLGFGPQADALLRNATIGMQMGAAAADQSNFQYQAQQSAARTGLGIAVQTALQQGNDQAALEGLTIGVADRVRATVNDNRWRDLLGNDTGGLGNAIDQQAKRSAYEALGIPMREGTTEPQTPIAMLGPSVVTAFQDMYRDNLSSILYENIMRTNNPWRIFSNPTATASHTTQRAATARERVSTDTRGRQSRSTTYEGIE